MAVNPGSQTKPGPKGGSREERGRMMLDYAERAIGERGYDAVSMEQVAAAAGVTKPIAYQLFGSKEGLFVAVVHRAYEDCYTRMEAAAAVPGAADERLWRMTLAFFGWLDAHRSQWRFVYGAQAVVAKVTEEGARDRAAIVALLVRVLSEIVTDPAYAGELEPIAEAAVAVHMAIGDRWTRHPEEPLELQAFRAMNVCWTGLSGLLEGRLWMPPAAD